jgi:predicted RNase H-like HicB family nuclease
MSDLRLHLQFGEGDDGWITVQVVEIPQAISQGRTREEARSNVLDALRELAAVYDMHGAGASDIEALELTPA